MFEKLKLRYGTILDVLDPWYNSTDRLLPKISIASAAQADRMEDENLYLSADWQRSLSPKGDRIQWIAGYVNSSNRFFFQDGPVPNRNDYQSLQSSFKYVFPNLRYPTGGTKLKSEVMLQNRYDLVSSGAFSAEQSRLTNALYANVQYSSSSALEWGLQMRAERFDQDLAPLTGSLSAKYSLRPEQFLHINLSRNYRLPGLNDLYWNPGGNPDLLPEQANSAELGYSHTWAKDDQITREEYKIEASLFAMGYGNIVVLSLADPQKTYLSLETYNSWQDDDSETGLWIVGVLNLIYIIYWLVKLAKPQDRQKPIE